MDEAEANGRLIAAAPDLLASLKTLVRFYEEENPESVMMANAGLEGPLSIARAAIEKAEGIAAS